MITHKVSLIGCENYDFEKVFSALKQSCENMGGLDKYISSGEKVLLKVNMLMKKRPEEATTTHPVFVKALAKILIDHGCEVIIGDSPGGPFNDTMLRGIYKATGMAAVAEEIGCKLNFNTGQAQKANPDGLLLKKLVLTDMLNDVDKVISVSKLKTHGMMTFTGAVKNMFGTVPGLIKAEYHVNMPAYDDFANALIDICLCANPVLSFMDAVDGMEGAGPSSGTPRHIGAVIACDSPYHLDKVACSIINLDFKKVPTITQSIKRGIASNGLDDVEIIGDKIEDFFISDFLIPTTAKSLSFNAPKILSNLIQQRPVFDISECVGCGACRDNCPAKVIEMTHNKPKVNLRGCIRCFCCQELCPKKAVSIKSPRLLRLIYKR